MRKRINFLQEFSIPLIAGVVLALFWANIFPHSYHEFMEKELFFEKNFHFLINDIFMVFFFAIAGVEITQSLLPGGALNPLKKAINPLFATLGGILGPITTYLLLNIFIGSSEFAKGWGIPTATDIALAWLVAKFILGEKNPAVKFLLLLAIADDALGLMIIAIFYPDHLHPTEPLWLVFLGIGVLAAYLLRKFNVRNYWPYIMVGGLLCWTGLYKAHLHPALALVPIIPFLPHNTKEKEELFEGDFYEYSTLTNFEHDWKVIVDLGLFFFGLANAGVKLSSIGVGTWLVLISLLLGKPGGIYLFAVAGEAVGFSLPDKMQRKEVLLVGLIAGIGLTVALFIAGAAFTDLKIQGEAKMGALLSVIAAFLAFVLARFLKIQGSKD